MMLTRILPFFDPAVMPLDRCFEGDLSDILSWA
jgi:hypothetical protein